ncbi:MAG: Crp/Fnr family transcriptional regulator [Oceanospirillaceae bacterium]|nr:Crp/Fnr family transcriptional regulator [Oceanospirillaceae bacterium]
MTFNELIQLEGLVVEKAKTEPVFRQGDNNQSLYFLQSGLLKAYYTCVDGKEFIKSFVMPGDTIGSLTSVHAKERCSFSLMCLEPSSLIEIPFVKIREHCAKDPELAQHMIEFLLQFSMKKEKREFQLLCLSAKDRYTLLLEESPQLLQQVTQNDLARYLGVTPVGLSRIKNRVLKA